jgi:alpha-galactosidase
MKAIKPLVAAAFLILTINGFSQSGFDIIENDRLLIDNGSIAREISFNDSGCYTKGLSLAGQNRNFVFGKSPEFRLILNGQKTESVIGWRKEKCITVNDERSGKGVKVILSGAGEAAGLSAEVVYLTYPGLPLIRKSLKLINRGSSDMKIEGVDIECLNLDIDYVSTWVYHNFARMKTLGTYSGDWNDPVIVIHNTTLRSGIAIGNETPGVLKRTVFHTTDRNAEAGLTHPEQDFPFRKWLRPGEEWQSPSVFIALYSGTDDGFSVINGTVNDYVRKFLGSRLSAIHDKPLFAYNTWNPFRTFITDSLIRDVAKAASECGIKEFIIDDGWEYNAGKKSSVKGWGENYGDWLTDRNKFPGDLAATFDYIRSLGMKPGLWISVGSATEDAKVFRDHPEWFIKTKKGTPGNNHVGWEGSTEFYTSCFGTNWISYIKSVILRLVKEHGLAYAKLDLSVVTSAYINNPAISGCYATDHPYHRDHEESLIVIYQNVLKLFDELHEEAPELFIDCTFETAGKLQLQDYAFVKHAEGNWLSNIEEPFPTGALRMRQLAWWRSPAMPAGSLVIGNLPLDSKNVEYDLKSLIGTLPIMLGDPRKLTAEQRSRLKSWSDWMVDMQEKYDYMSFRQDLPGFGEPSEGHWDGWARINTESKTGGIIGVFRHGASENSRTVFIKTLDPLKTYEVLLAPERKKIKALNGAQLSKEGFIVKFNREYEGAVFEIRSIN